MRDERQKRTAAGARPRLSKERKEKDFPATENTPPAPKRQACGTCLSCSFSRAVDLPSGRVRRLCMLSGERLTAAATACAHFMPGRWETTWADPDAPRQSLVCELCGNAVAPTRRAALLGATLCRLHRPEARSAAPVACPAFRVRRGEGVHHAL